MSDDFAVSPIHISRPTLIASNPMEEFAIRLAKEATLPDSPLTEAWIRTAKDLAENAPGDHDLYKILWGLVAAFKQYGITYNWGGASMRRPKSPAEVISSKQARCFDSARLAAASLLKLTDEDFSIVIIALPTHFLAGVILDEPRLEGLKGVKISIKDKASWLFPFEFDFDPKDNKFYTVENANQRGLNETINRLYNMLIIEAGTGKGLIYF